ncbi:helix-turn-helix transcriptional regulator [Microbacterium sp.]|uniref:helix-turn-helix transcriptional regulator n=1 Tax=Microbacterium sp. TaxID=51671 RepID=UPI003C779FD9
MTGDDGVRAQFAVEWGWSLVLNARPNAGLRLLHEAHAAEGAWTQASLPWVRSLLVCALAVGGQRDQATELLGQLLVDGGAPLYEADIGIAEAAVAALTGGLSLAARRSRDAAVAAETRGQRYLAMVAWYGALRYGDASCAPAVLRTLGAPETETDEAIARHARGVRDRNAEQIVDAARMLIRTGHRWFAAEAWAQAALLHRRVGRREAAAQESARLAEFLNDTDGLASPVIAALHHPVLTEREAEIARLVAGGLSDAEAAETLGLSARTVQTHLTRVYAKLRIAGRGELTRVLPAAPGRHDIDMDMVGP